MATRTIFLIVTSISSLFQIIFFVFVLPKIPVKVKENDTLQNLKKESNTQLMIGLILCLICICAQAIFSPFIAVYLWIQIVLYYLLGYSKMLNRLDEKGRMLTKTKDE